MRLHLAPLVAALLLLAAPAHAEGPAEEPSRGTALLTLGALGIAGGIATTPMDMYCPAAQRAACTWGLAAARVALFGGGFAMGIVGGVRRAEWSEWKKGVRLGAAPTPGGAAMVVSGSF